MPYVTFKIGDRVHEVGLKSAGVGTIVDWCGGEKRPGAVVDFDHKLAPNPRKYYLTRLQHAKD
jgi:hypothetical protein